MLCVGDGMLHEALNGLAAGATALAAVPGAGHLPGRQRNGVANSLLGRFMTSSRSRRCSELGGNISSPIGANLGARLADHIWPRALPIDAAVPPKYDLHYFCWGVFADTTT